MTFIHKQKKKDVSTAEYGTFRHAFQTKIKDPREFYHMRLEYLKNKKREKQKCSVCGEQADYVDGILKKVYYCEKCKDKR